MKNIDLQAHLSCFSERSAVIVRVPAHVNGTDKDTHHLIHSVTEESGEDGLVVVITLGFAVTP